MLVIDFGDSLPSWVVLLSPADFVFGVLPRFSLEYERWLGSWERNRKAAQAYLDHCGRREIVGFAPQAIVPMLFPSEEETVFATVQGFYWAWNFPIQSFDTAEQIADGIDGLLEHPGMSVLVPYRDDLLEREGWLSNRKSSARCALLLFSAGLFDGGRPGVRSIQLDRIRHELLDVLAGPEEIAANALELDPRLYKAPVFSLGLRNVLDGDGYETDIWFEIAALRAKLVSRLADNFLYSEVEAELLRLREDYAELFVGRDALLQELEHDLSLYLEKFKQGIGQLTLL